LTYEDKPPTDSFHIRRSEEGKPPIYFCGSFTLGTADWSPWLIRAARYEEKDADAISASLGRCEKVRVG
jgi:hypothetical protein